VADICARLDGLPLAIELAAARLRLLSLDDLRRGLTERLPLLTSRARDLPERQRTLRNTIDWSYRLLAPDEQALLRRLSVFVGGWTWESAEAVVGAPEGSGRRGPGNPGGVPRETAELSQGGAPVDRDGPVDGLETLVEHSLVWRQETAASARFRMLATIREYAGERLEQAGERDRLRRRHASWFGERAQEAYLNIDSEDQLASLDWFDAEMANVRAALTWALERPGEPERLELALSLVRSLGYLWYTRGLTREALSWLDQIAAVAGDAPPDQRGPLLYWLGAFATRQGRAEQAAAAYTEAVELFTMADDDTTRVSKTLNALGAVALSQGDYAEARRRWDQALELARQEDSADARHTEAFIVANLGDLALEEGDAAGARELLDQAMELLAPRGDRWANAVIQRYLAEAWPPSASGRGPTRWCRRPCRCCGPGTSGPSWPTPWRSSRPWPPRRARPSGWSACWPARPPSAAPPGHPSATTSAPSWPGGWSRPASPSAATCSPPPTTTSPGAGP
jgi:tetratricopeptide (TPR) repeat protein